MAFCRYIKVCLCTNIMLFYTYVGNHLTLHALLNNEADQLFFPDQEVAGAIQLWSPNTIRFVQYI